jgi:hypothetical protein
MKNRLHTAFLTVILVLVSLTAQAQFQEPEFRKMTEADRAWFMNKFEDIKWTGRGLYDDTEIDDMQTNELRARLQARFGDPTQTIEHLINQPGFRPAEAIEFEYWFTVDDSIPLMVLDVDGPFGRGLVYGGASRYIDLMPQIKRAFAKKLMNDNKPVNFQDYYYSPERGKWFDVRYENGKYITKEIDSPKGMVIDFDIN